MQSFRRRPTQEEQQKYLLLDILHINTDAYIGYTGEVPIATFTYKSKGEIKFLAAFEYKDILTFAKLMREAKENLEENAEKCKVVMGIVSPQEQTKETTTKGPK